MRKKIVEQALVTELSRRVALQSPQYSHLAQIGIDVGKLVQEKNTAYGNSFQKAGEFLKLLYPNGVRPDQYTDMLLITRIFDKMMRIATDKDAFGETPFKDITGYGILGVSIHPTKERRKRLVTKK